MCIGISSLGAHIGKYPSLYAKKWNTLNPAKCKARIHRDFFPTYVNRSETNLISAIFLLRNINRIIPAILVKTATSILLIVRPIKSITKIRFVPIKYKKIIETADKKNKERSLTLSTTPFDKYPSMTKNNENGSKSKSKLAKIDCEKEILVINIKDTISKTVRGKFLRIFLFTIKYIVIEVKNKTGKNHIADAIFSVVSKYRRELRLFKTENASCSTSI